MWYFYSSRASLVYLWEVTKPGLDTGLDSGQAWFFASAHVRLSHCDLLVALLLGKVEALGCNDFHISNEVIIISDSEWNESESDAINDYDGCSSRLQLSIQPQ